MDRWDMSVRTSARFLLIIVHNDSEWSLFFLHPVSCVFSCMHDSCMHVAFMSGHSISIRFTGVLFWLFVE